MKTKNLRIQTTQTLQNETAQFVFGFFGGFFFFLLNLKQFIQDSSLMI